MSPESSRRTYRAVEVQSSNPADRIVTLYDHLLVNLVRADKQIRADDVSGKSRSLIKAGEIVAGLSSALDMEKGGEIAVRLEALYNYFSAEILEVNRTNDLEKLASVTAMVRELHDAWTQAAAQTKVEA